MGEKKKSFDFEKSLADTGWEMSGYHAFIALGIAFAGKMVKVLAREVAINQE